MTGDVVGSYRVLDVLGEGGMGIVYAGEHVTLGHRVAIKVLLPEMSRNPELVQRFFNEARAATTIQHPGIVRIFDFGTHPSGSAYFVMELLPGESLATRLSRRGALPFASVASIGRQLAGALEAAHARGIVHRDLKPDNVFLVPDPDVVGGERAKILDFGIAKLAGEPTLSVKTKTGSVMGTPTYMSPEQCRGAGAVDHRSDIYSLGCILFEMACGRPPFVADGLGEMLAAHQYLEPPAPRAFAPAIPQALEVLLVRTLAKAPEHRHATMRELAEDLGRLKGLSEAPTVVAGHAAETIVARPITTLAAAAGQTQSAASRRSWWPALVAGTAVAIAAVAFVMTRSAEERSPAMAAAPAVDAAPRVLPRAQTVPDAAPAPALIAITIDSDPAGAEVRLGDERLGRTPWTSRREATDGALTFTLSLDGHEPSTLTVPADREIRERVALVPIESKTPRKRSVGKPPTVAPTKPVEPPSKPASKPSDIYRSR